MNVTRRHFLSTTTLAAASLAVAATPAARAANKRGIKRALKYGMITEGTTVLEKMQIARQAGFEGVEFDVGFALQHKDEILAAKRTTGLEVPGLIAGGGLGRKFSDPNPQVRVEGLEAFRVGLQTAKDLGGTTVLLYPSAVTKENPYDQVYEMVQTGIRAVTPAAEKTGIKIALENVWNNFLLSPLEARNFLDEIKHPLVGWYFDVGNVVTYGWPEQWIRILNRRIFKLDIKEFSRKKQNEEGKPKGFQVPLGEGDCDWPAVMKALDEVRYSGGWGSAEVRGGNREHLADIAQRMDRIFSL